MRILSCLLGLVLWHAAASATESTTGRDIYGGLLGLHCPANPGAITYTISTVARAGTTVTITLSAAASPALWTNAEVIISGTSADGGSFNSPEHSTTAQPFSLTGTGGGGTTLTFTQTGNAVGSTADTGTVTLARWWPCQLEGRMWVATPWGHPMRIHSVQALELENGQRPNGINTLYAWVYKHTPYLGESDGQLSANLAMLALIQRYGFNAVGEYGMTTNSRTMPMYPSYTTTSDGYNPIKLPTYAVWDLTNTAVRGDHGDRVKFISPYFKRSTTYYPDYLSWTGSCGQSNALDVFAPAWADNVNGGYSTAAAFPNPEGTFHSKYASYLIGVNLYDQDRMALTKGGSDDFQLYDGGNWRTPVGAPSGFHFGYLVLVMSPQASVTYTGSAVDSACSANWDSIVSATGIVLSDPVVYSKAELVNWLQGTSTLDQTTGVTATRSGTTVTYTKAAHPYIPHELLTVTACSDATFNSVAGTGVTVTATTTTTFTVALTGAGATATGCQVNTGPGFATIGALNTRWGTSYTQFGTTATTVTLEAGFTGDINGVNKTFTKTLANVPDPFSIRVYNDGTLTCGDDGAGPVKNTPDATGSFRGVGCTMASSSVNYTTGAVTIVFATAPTVSVAVTYTYGGWNNGGTGVADENGGATGITNPFTLAGNANLKADMDNFLTAYSKRVFRVGHDALATYAPGVLFMGSTNIGTSDTPPRRQVLWGMAPYVDVLGAHRVVGGHADDQARGDFLTNHLGLKPWVIWHGLTANIDSGLAVGGVSAARTGDTVVFTRVSGHPFTTNSGIIVSGCSDATFNIATQLGISSYTSTTFTSTLAGAGASATGCTVSLADPDGPPQSNDTWAVATYTTQAARGAAYKAQIEAWDAFTDTATGVKPFAGSAWWNVVDQYGEASNWGLFTMDGDAYDGMAATTRLGQDALGHPTGCSWPKNSTGSGLFWCQQMDYGDFLTPVTQANSLWLNRLTRPLKSTGGGVTGTP